MQKTIIAGSLAVLASGASFPHNVAKRAETQMMAKAKAQMKTASAPVTRGSSLRGLKHAKGKGKGKRKDDDEDDEDEDEGDSIPMSKYMEWNFGSAADCSDYQFTGGFGLGLCENYVDKDENGFGLPRSHHFLPGTNGIVYEAFLNHGCTGTAAATMPFGPELFGLPSSYVLGDCADLGGFYAKFQFKDEMHVPTYDSVTTAHGVEAQSCLEGSLIEYEIQKVVPGSCNEEDGEYYSWDVSTCNSGSFTKTFYSDNACTTVDHVETDLKTNCLYDIENFQEGIADAEENFSGKFNYAFSTCNLNVI